MADGSRLDRLWAGCFVRASSKAARFLAEFSGAAHGWPERGRVDSIVVGSITLAARAQTRDEPHPQTADCQPAPLSRPGSIVASLRDARAGGGFHAIVAGGGGQ